MTLRAANGNVIPLSGKAEFRIGLDKLTFKSGATKLVEEFIFRYGVPLQIH